MTDPLRALADFLLATIEVTNVVGSRIYPDSVPQGVARPLILITQLNSDVPYWLRGECGAHQTQISVNIITAGDRGRTEAFEASEIIRNRISGYRGALNSDVYSHGIHVIRMNLVAVQPTDGGDAHSRTAAIDVTLTHTAAIPNYQ